MSPSPTPPFRRSSPPFPIPDWVAAKIGIGLLGLAIVGVGYWLWRSGGGLVEGLNYDYRRYHERFRVPLWEYPEGSHKVLGCFFIGFGLLIAVVALVAVR